MKVRVIEMVGEHLWEKKTNCERCANDDGHSEINDIALRNERAELHVLCVFRRDIECEIKK